MPRPTHDLTGRQFGRLTATRRVPAPGRAHWACTCSCGAEAAVEASALLTGRTKSCGCLQREVSRDVNVRHGHNPEAGPSLTYSSWAAMKQRCLNPNNTGYATYGGAGVAVCDRWLSFDNFLADMGERPSADHCLSRKNDSGNYEPGNVVWGLKSTNSREAATRRWAA